MRTRRNAIMLALIVVCSPAVWRAALAADDKPAIKVDAKARTVSVPCKIAPRKLASLPEIYPIEVIATYPTPKGQKAHETVVIFDESIKPSDVHKALEQLGLKAGKPAKGEDAQAVGPEVKIYLEVPGAVGVTRLPIEKTLVDRKTGKTMPTLKWKFTGSAMTQPDPNKDEKVYAADLTGTLIAIFPVTDETVFQTNLTMKYEPLLKMETNKKVLPPEGTAVTLVIDAKASP